MPATAWSSASSRSQRCDPMNPAAPVTKHCMLPPVEECYQVESAGRNPDPILIDTVTRLLATLVLLASTPLIAAEPTPAERGHKALTETAFIPAFWTNRVVQDAWKTWPG